MKRGEKMQLEDFIALIPATLIHGVFITSLKAIKINLSKEMNQAILEKGLYHVVPNKKVASKIIESGKILESKNIFYGKPYAYMFAGIPEIDNYIKNLDNDPLLEPEKIIQAVKFRPMKEELSNYKTRIQQDAILYEGSCMIPEERTQMVELVIDIVKEEGTRKLILRERTKEEIEKSPEVHILSQECLEMIEEEKIKNGYIKNDNLGILNGLNQYKRETQIEMQYAKEGIKNTIKEWIAKIKNHSMKQLDESENDKIHRTIEGIEQGQIRTKKSVRSKKYVDTIIKLNREGIRQQTLSRKLPEILGTREGEYLKKKVSTMNQDKMKKEKTQHNNRVALLAIAIASQEKIPLEDNMLDLLIQASYEHDKAKILNLGPDAKRGAKLVEKGEFYHANGLPYTREDKNLLKAIVEAHEGSDRKFEKIIRKYEIKEEDKETAKKLFYILRNADALDRARGSTKEKMDLSPKFLQYDSAKSLINFSFQLEALTNKVKDFKTLLNYEPKVEIKKQRKPREFVRELKERTILQPIEKEYNCEIEPSREKEEEEK